MSERPTPIVDSCEFTVPLAGKVITSKTARRLERERDEARRKLMKIEDIANDAFDTPSADLMKIREISRLEDAK